MRARAYGGKWATDDNPIHLKEGLNATMDMKGRAKKRGRTGGVKRKNAAASLGRSPVTGASVLKPMTRGASISLDDVRRIVRTMKPLALD